MVLKPALNKGLQLSSNTKHGWKPTVSSVSHELGKITNLSLDGSKDVNFIRLQQGIADGSKDVEDVGQAELRGDISNTQANTLRTQASREGRAANEAYKGEPKEIATDWGDRYEATS